MVDKGNGYSLIKSISYMDCTKVPDGQPLFISGHIYSLQR